ncbi:MAG TPA: polysaccharide biosynthesis/export family protein, partial [Emticicia sp.]
ILAIIIGFSSCKLLRPSFMLKTKKDYKFDVVTDSLTKENYRISSTDEIEFKVFANDGFKLIDLSAGNGTVRAPSIEETVDKEGKLKLPVLGKVYVAGLTLREAQALLEKEYEAYYVKPFVQLKITNKRVIVFPGRAGDAKVVPIVNNNTTLFEVLAMAGGISDEGKAYRIKLIRRPNMIDTPKVYLIDLSKIEGIMQGNITMLANDIVYVETRPKVAQKALQEITPYLSLLTSTLTLYYIFTK